MIARPGHILVVDVSEAQWPQAWSRLADRGVRAAIVRASEGQWHPDPMWWAHAEGAAHAGLMVGSYHAFHPRHADPREQARRYCDRAYDITMLAPALDVERLIKGEAASTVEGIPLALVAERALACLVELDRLWLKRPWLYSGSDFLAQLAKAAPDVCRELAAYPLWLADYRPQAHVPAPWSSWACWQWTCSAGVVAPHALDLSWWRGDEASLARAGWSRAGEPRG